MRAVPPAAGTVKVQLGVVEAQSPDHAPTKVSIVMLVRASDTEVPAGYTTSHVPEVAPVTGAIVQSMRWSVDWTRPPPVKPATGRTLTVPVSAKLPAR
jgi:hypothetical protein